MRRNEYSPLQFFGHDGFVGPAANVASSQFLLNLLFGTRGVGVPVTLDMAVDNLIDIAAGIAQLDTGLVILRFGTVVMQPGMFLRDYLSRADHQGATVTVVSRMSSPRVTTPRVITFPPGAPTAPQGITSPIMQSERSGTPPSPAHLFTDPMYSINLVYEDGHTISQIVWLGMTIAQLRQIVATPFRVPPERVFFACHGQPLAPGRTLGTPPAILANAYVYAFFSEHAMHLFLSPGAANFPASPRPQPPYSSPQVHGPALPPGFVRQSPGPRDASSHPPTRGAAHDKLRSGFRCPKFLGEARNWKAWNKGFVRFLAIQNLDHVIAESFMAQPLSITHQEENKLVYYIIEDAVTGSTVATQHVRRAAE